ncbi:hypothetical protein Salat_1846500 [Sesamum alatum]|uniref:Uncharacterized protein n=1 Tax=Sesamum alatum TaxID=300844 RepID=A0AAE1Y2X8_9LAMI|nr:hypothetical protein Salat_1846500 [Sesamum alatum]
MGSVDQDLSAETEVYLGCPAWLGALGAGNRFLKLRDEFRRGISFKVGDGSVFLLWQDPWHPLGILIKRYPRAPRVTRLHERTLLQEVIHGGEWVWPRPTAAEVMQIMTITPPIQGGPDAIEWNANRGSFSASSALELFQPHPPPVDMHGPCRDKTGNRIST